MARLTKSEKSQIARIFHGINPRTFEVETVYLTREGVFQKTLDDGSVETHRASSSRSDEDALLIGFGLKNIISFLPMPPGSKEWDNQKKAVEELEKKAAEMKRKVQGD